MKGGRTFEYFSKKEISNEGGQSIQKLFRNLLVLLALTIVALMVAINGAEDTEAASSLRLIYLDDHLPHDPLVNHFNLTYLGQTPG